MGMREAGGYQELKKVLSLSFLVRTDSRKRDGAVFPTGVWSWWTLQSRSGDSVQHNAPPNSSWPTRLSREQGEGKSRSPQQGDRQQSPGSPESWGQQPVPTKTPPTHAESNQKGWLALSLLSLCLPQAQESMVGEPCSRREEIISYNDSKGRAPRTWSSQNPKETQLPV